MSGLTLDVAGVVQIRFSGIFEKKGEPYADPMEYPYGPPSSYNREIMIGFDPENRISTFFFNSLRTDPDVGFYFLVIGFGLQFLGILTN